MQAFSFNDVATSLAVLLGVVPKAVDEKVASKVSLYNILHFIVFCALFHDDHKI